MSIFRKSIPAACPKCGKSDGWHILDGDPAYSAGNTATAVNAFSSAPIRNTFGQNMTASMGKRRKVRYHCDDCGFERSY